MAKLADALDLGSSGAIHVGSTPIARTKAPLTRSFFYSPNGIRLPLFNVSSTITLCSFAIFGTSPSCCSAVFFEAFDVSIVNLALPVMAGDLHLTLAETQWVQTLYLITLGGFLLPGGRLCDVIGSRTVFLIGMTLFAGLAAGQQLLDRDRLSCIVGIIAEWSGGP